MNNEYILSRNRLIVWYAENKGHRFYIRRSAMGHLIVTRVSRKNSNNFITTEYRKAFVPDLERCESCDLNGCLCNKATYKALTRVIGECLPVNGKEMAWKFLFSDQHGEGSEVEV